MAKKKKSKLVELKKEFSCLTLDVEKSTLNPENCNVKHKLRSRRLHCCRAIVSCLAISLSWSCNKLAAIWADVHSFIRSATKLVTFVVAKWVIYLHNFVLFTKDTNMSWTLFSVTYKISIRPKPTVQYRFLSQMPVPFGTVYRSDLPCLHSKYIYVN